MRNLPFAGGAGGAGGYVFFEPDAVAAREARSPSGVRGGALGGYGGGTRRRNADAQHFSLAKKRGAILRKNKLPIF